MDFINIADLKHRIRIMLETEKTDDEGFRTKDYKELYKVWGAKRFISGKQYLEAKATNSENIISFIIRYNKKIMDMLNLENRKNIRLIIKNEVYKVEFANNVKDASIWIDIKATEVEVNE